MLLACVTQLYAQKKVPSFIILEGKRIDPPFRVEVVDERVLLNGIQVFPHVANKAQSAEEKRRAEARDLLSSLHDELIRREKVDGKERAIDWIKADLKKRPQFPNATVQDTKMGVMVNLTGIDDIKRMDEMNGYFTYMRADNAPSSRKRHRAAGETIRGDYVGDRRRLGKQKALDMVKSRLAATSGIAEYWVNYETESYDIRWEGEPYKRSVGLWPEGHSEAEVYGARDTPSSGQMHLLQFEAHEIQQPIDLGLCLVILGGHKYISFKQGGCEVILTTLNKPSPEAETLGILKTYFRGNERALWKDVRQYWESK